MSKRPILTQDFLKSILDYDPETGIFVWRVRADRHQRWNSRYAGRAAGYDWSPDGKTIYRVIHINDYPYSAHCLAVLYVTGVWPKALVDHRDLDGTNNRWVNLREASQHQNGYNRGANKNSKTGVKGVSPHKGKYRASIQANGVWQQLGIFDTISEAKDARDLAATRLHGEFSRAS